MATRIGAAGVRVAGGAWTTMIQPARAREKRRRRQRARVILAVL